MRVLVPAYDKQIFITEVVNSYKALFEVDIREDSRQDEPQQRS